MSAPEITRFSLLGGEVVKRGILARAPQSRICRVVLVIGLAYVLLSMISGINAAVTAVDVLILLALWWLTWPRQLGQTQPRLDEWLQARRRARRRRRALTMFTAPTELRPGHLGPAWSRPPMIGRVAPLDLSGTAYEPMFILHHTNPGAGHYLTVLTATGGMGSGFQSDERYAQLSAGFGNLLASFAGPDRFITEFTQINRAVPHDAQQHEQWMIGQLRPPPAGAPATVRAGYGKIVRSYSELVQASTQAEQHANYLLVHLQITPAFLAQAKRYGGGNAGMAEVVVEELRVLSARVAAAGLEKLTVLGERRTVAAMRSLQSPDYAAGRHGGATWSDAFLTMDTAPDFGSVIVEGKWHTRTGFIPPGGLSQARYGPRWLASVLTDLHPSIVHTVTSRLVLVPATHARAAAVADYTTDTASTRKDAQRGLIDDGTGQALKTASQVRLTDLAPGSGHAGLDWGLFITVQAGSADDLADACTRLRTALHNSGVERFTWPTDQDLAWSVALPLGRGVKK